VEDGGIGEIAFSLVVEIAEARPGVVVLDSPTWKGVTNVKVL